MSEPAHNYVSRGGLKLEHALREFNVDVRGLWCADLGCSTGGFTDCLLQLGAERVFAVDTAYGEFAWKLRKDPKVTLRERTNALHAEPDADVKARGGVELVVVDMGWTPQKLVIPVALKWLKPGGRIITLIKPHYELSARTGRRHGDGVLDEATATQVNDEVVATLPSMGVRVLGVTRSPIMGGASKNKSGKGNLEWLAVLER